MKFLTFIFIILSPFALGQTALDLKPITQFKITGSEIYIDNVGNLYTVNRDEITQYNSQFKQVNVFSNKIWGDVFFFDGTNALKMLAFYRNQSKIAFLDNKLSIRGEPIVLNNLGLEQSILACSSYLNGFWLYDQVQLSLFRVNQNLQVEIKTGNLNQILQKNISPNFMIERNNKLYLGDKNLGILVFDVFGNYLKTIPVKPEKSFVVGENKIFWIANNQLFVYNEINLSQQTFTLPITDVVAFQKFRNHLYFLANNTVYVFQVSI